MKRVYSSLNSMLVDNFCNALQQQGIDCEVRNRYGSSLLGGIPVSESLTELWVADANAEQAERVVQGLVEEAEERQYGAAWTCGVCGTEVEGSLDECWQCAEAKRQEELRNVRDSPIPAYDEFSSRVSPLVVWIAIALVALWWITNQP